ncbi:glycine cleavage system protein H [Sulfolobus acidocaldarius]|uniref:Probable glycine cleavage system H protein 3 n=4 Tax=Sulfolobus acidocaldarius TaxID=2285 RepID=GCSH3_SULAC|nr:glycine cleavage system protein H [Sulfolobus acidocaldarius]Q4JBR4.1 RecName: Full=Probable glycine cleavage system H protein 3 [Sulfolobus acidocaldarius DSM 639]AAY79765.1 glycine cleavage H-protein [Sulfolobus acidocaldarius DSM 639]AGE70323.1 glycine cleavage H-protein [Sulfolobus acidocaldarius N8]AGE72598.1 glycine cleavage H-protein [Sulfolobus acidocaldarius Ron12/I]ALU29278.1 glycine cleavage system protein H [Sulfolobus acidocaldarius]ALU32007.1 glycine cleavage system protein H
MKISFFNFPDDLLYEPERHVWIKVEENKVVSVGMTDLGQYLAGKIFQVSVPRRVGERVNNRTILFSVESAKWIGKIRLQIEGEVVDINERVIKNPSIINEDPYGSWIIKVSVTDVDLVKRAFKNIQDCRSQFEEEANRIVSWKNSS